MNDLTKQQTDSSTIEPLKKWTAIVYLCQVLTFGFAGLPLLIGLAINFIKRKEVAGTWLESHFQWQIRTFWFTLVWTVLGGITAIFVIGWFILSAAMLWLIYRVAKGWLYLNEKRALPV